MAASTARPAASIASPPRERSSTTPSAIDVRSEATTNRRLSRVADGRPPARSWPRVAALLPSLHLTSHDQSAPGRRAASGAESRLSQELHRASAWMRDQDRPSLAWVRHPGLQLPNSSPLVAGRRRALLEQQAVIDEELDTFLDEWLDCADERWTFVLTSGRGRPAVERPRTTVAVIRPRDLGRPRPRPADGPRSPAAKVSADGVWSSCRPPRWPPRSAGNDRSSTNPLTDRLERPDPVASSRSREMTGRSQSERPTGCSSGRRKLIASRVKGCCSEKPEDVVRRLRRPLDSGG